MVFFLLLFSNLSHHHSCGSAYGGFVSEARRCHFGHGNILSPCKTGNDEEEKTVSYDYDGNQVIQTDYDGSVSRHTYYPNGNLLAKTGENLQFSYNLVILLLSSYLLDI